MPQDFKELKATISRPSGPSRAWHRVEGEDNLWLAWYQAPPWGKKEKKIAKYFTYLTPFFRFFPPPTKPGARLTYDWRFGGPKQLLSNQRD